MLSIQDPESAQLNHDHQSTNALAYLLQQPILDLPFRSYFLLAVMSSLFALSMWAAYFNGYFIFSDSALSPLTWHIHEMIFGFGATVAIGFVLTAAQTWTGLPSIKGLPVLFFISLWLMVRVALLVNSSSSLIIAIALQSFWWLGSIVILSRLLLKSHNKRNYLFIPLFSIMMLLNIALLVLDFNGYYALTQHIARTSVLLFCLLMGILGGRVIPFFTISGAKVEATPLPKWITPLLTISSILGVVGFFCSLFIKLPFSPAVLMITSGMLHLIRQCYWQSFSTRNITLLWSLHLAYFALGLGLILLGLSYFHTETIALFNLSITFADALHLITIAAMTLMIFSMMSRVSLGHTGRALIPAKQVSWIFFFIILSALTRAILPLITLQPLIAWNISVLAWLCAGLLFLKVYFPILASKKIEKNFRH